jgi:hypothetical protein
VLGAIVAGGVLYVIASGQAGFDVSKGFASNGYGTHSPGGYSMLSALVIEIVLTMFLIVILGATDRRAPAGFAPLPIGLALTLIHLISIPVTNTSVNPARSTGVALYVGDWATSSVAVLAGTHHRCLAGSAGLPPDRGRRPEFYRKKAAQAFLRVARRRALPGQCCGVRPVDAAEHGAEGAKPAGPSIGDAAARLRRPGVRAECLRPKGLAAAIAGSASPLRETNGSGCARWRPHRGPSPRCCAGCRARP